MTKKVNVTASFIRNVQVGSDGGGDLEIFGELFAKRVKQVIINSREVYQDISVVPLWQRSSGDHIVLSAGASLPICVTRQIAIEPSEYLSFGGHLLEHDSCDLSHDDLGTKYQNVRHDNINYHKYDIKFEQDGQKVEVGFVTLLAT
jgi:hypothetical protein